MTHGEVGARVMRSEFPLEQLVKHDSHRFQMGFARQVIRDVTQTRRFRDRVLFEASHDGLLMLAQNEEALAEPLNLLRDLYEESLVVLQPRVRYLSLGNEQFEPIMVARVRVLPRDLQAVRADLLAREATLLDEDRNRGACVLRAEVPLRNLLGYGRELSALTGGTGEYCSWLDRYARMPTGPNAA